MGSGASFTSLSAEELGAGVGALGAAYKKLQDGLVQNGIDGKYVFEVVKDEDEKFKSFLAENFGVTMPLQQNLLLSKYLERLRTDDGETNNNGDGKLLGSASVFDVRDTVQRPPRDILSELFLIQGIPLDPDNVNAAVDKITAAVQASVGEAGHAACDGKTTFDCFISYRVAADKDIAEKIHDKLSLKGLFPFLDKVKLKDGMPWKEGFLQGLSGSKCFVSVISRKALESCRDMKRNHTWDNVLLEIETALRYKATTGNASYIIPVHVGEYVNVNGAQMLCKFADFGGGIYADTIDGAGMTVKAAAAVASAAAVATAAAGVGLGAAKSAASTLAANGENVCIEGEQMLRKFADFGGGMFADTIDGDGMSAKAAAAAAAMAAVGAGLGAAKSAANTLDGAGMSVKAAAAVAAVAAVGVGLGAAKSATSTLATNGTAAAVQKGFMGLMAAGFAKASVDKATA